MRPVIGDWEQAVLANEIRTRWLHWAGVWMCVNYHYRYCTAWLVAAPRVLWGRSVRATPLQRCYTTRDWKECESYTSTEMLYYKGLEGVWELHLYRDATLQGTGRSVRATPLQRCYTTRDWKECESYTSTEMLYYKGLEGVWELHLYRDATLQGTGRSVRATPLQRCYTTRDWKESESYTSTEMLHYKGLEGVWELHLYRDAILQGTGRSLRATPLQRCYTTRDWKECESYTSTEMLYYKGLEGVWELHLYRDAALQGTGRSVRATPLQRCCTTRDWKECESYTSTEMLHYKGLEGVWELHLYRDATLQGTGRSVRATSLQRCYTTRDWKEYESYTSTEMLHYKGLEGVWELHLYRDATLQGTGRSVRATPLQRCYTTRDWKECESYTSTEMLHYKGLEGVWELHLYRDATLQGTGRSVRATPLQRCYTTRDWKECESYTSTEMLHYKGLEGVWELHLYRDATLQGTGRSVRATPLQRCCTTRDWKESESYTSTEMLHYKGLEGVWELHLYRDATLQGTGRSVRATPLQRCYTTRDWKECESYTSTEMLHYKGLEGVWELYLYRDATLQGTGRSVRATPLQRCYTTRDWKECESYTSTEMLHYKGLEGVWELHLYRDATLQGTGRSVRATPLQRCYTTRDWKECVIRKGWRPRGLSRESAVYNTRIENRIEIIEIERNKLKNQIEKSKKIGCQAQP